MRTRPVSWIVVVCIAAFAWLTPVVAQGQVLLTINDVTQPETNAGTTTFTFIVSLSAPAGPGGVTFDITTTNDTALDSSDYVAQSLTGQTIPAGSSTYGFNVLVNGDGTAEIDERFFVNVTNITGATFGDGQGVGTIVNDDITRIHDIQGNGGMSPLLNAPVRIRGIVTGVEANGFFVQEEDAEVDADPMTSEGIFVSTISPPPAAAAFSALVEVAGTVAEVFPVDDPADAPSTQIISPTVVQLALGQPLPTAVPLSSTFPDPAGPFDQLERVEHMRVTVASITVSGPSQGSVDENAATGTSNGNFHGVVTGVARPFREAGIQAPDVPPSGSIPPIPRWDANPERIRIESAALVGQPALTVKSGDMVGPITGPLDYGGRSYAIDPDGTSTPLVTPGTLATTTVTNAAANEFTVASVRLRRFYDTTDDAYADPVLTAEAYDRRLAKTSIAIRDHLRNPDIIGVQEVENITVLNDLVARILADGGPTYAPYLMEGNDPSGLDVGVLIKTDPVIGGVARVSNPTLLRIGADATWPDPATGMLEILYDRPPLVLLATINRAATVSVPIAVIVTDLAGLTGINSEETDGLTTVGDRVRQRRQAQAALVANYVQGLDPSVAEHLVVIGSFHAFEMNDGYVDVLNVVAGTPPPDNETVVAGDGVDLVNPDLVNLVNTPPPAERYSDVFDGNARNVDHALISAGLVSGTIARRIEHPRIAADYPETHVGDGSTALRFSDRDPVVAYFATDTLNIADLQVTNVDAPDPVLPGQNLTHTITVTNNGPDTAESVTLSNALAGMTFVSLSSPADWSCTTPAVGAGGSVQCSSAAMSPGSAVFTITGTVIPLPPGMLSNTATVSSTTADPTPANNSALATTIIDGAPTISDIPSQTIAEDGATAALPFTIGDNVTPAASLTVSVSSSDHTLVPDANIVLGGAGANRTVTVTPAANRNGGPLVITVTVSDSVLVSSDTFAVTVTPVNDAPTIAPIASQTANANTTVGPLPMSIDDIDDDVSSLTLSATSSNQTLVADAGLSFGGSGASRSLTITPLHDRSGQTTITVTVSDGESQRSTSFVLTIDAPTTQRTYYLAEGATGEFFDEDLLIANPNAGDAPVTVTFFREDGGSVTQTRTIPGRSGVRLRVDSLPGLEATAASVQVSSDSDLPLAVERTHAVLGRRIVRRSH